MKCTTCHAENPDRAKFCVECGSTFASRCASCSAELIAGAKFCAECGTRVGGAKPAPAPAPRETPKHLADKIRQSKAAVEGERKQVTVLFADVKGSMELAESLDPEAFSKIMSKFFAILTEGVERFEGFVDKFTGDGIMALFGAPIAHEDHAQRACYAALHLRDEIARYATELKREHGLSFSTRMGLNSGEVVVGSISDDLRMDYTAQGHTVGLAQRMENLASPDTCFMSAATAKLVSGYFALDDLGEFRVKGVATPMHVHRLNGIGSSKTRLDVSRSRGLSRFVGRGDEMHLLEAALAKADAGAGQVIGIVGEAGLGKSRICYEFLERCRERGLMTYQTTGVAHGKSIPFMPMLKLFRAFYGITDQDSAATARERIAGRMLLLDERLREVLPLTFEFLGVPDPDNPPQQMDADARQRQMFDVVRRMIQARGQKETSVTLLEDLHWFDGGSAAFLEPMITAAAGTRSLVLLNFRPEYLPPWLGKSYYHQLPLTPLGPEAIRELLAALLGNDASTRGLGTAIHAQTAGNPFFTEEVVQNLIETGKLQGGKGAYRLTTTVEKLEVPSSVHALLAARIDRLAAREKDVLQTAAVIGREFDEPTLHAVTELDAPQLREALTALKDTEFVYEQSLYPVTEYLFKHPLTQEVALNSQLQARRQRLHAKVAAVLEVAHAKDLDGHAALLAHHWEEAADITQALHWHRRAAQWAGSRDPIQGFRHWQKVRLLGRSLDDTASEQARLEACAFTLTLGAWRLGMSEVDVQDCLDEARSLAKDTGQAPLLALALSGRAGHLGMIGRMAEGLDLAEEAVGMISDGREHPETLSIEATRAYLYYTNGRLPQALQAFDRMVALAGGDPEMGMSLAGFSLLMWGDHMAGQTLALKGQFAEARSRMERSLRMSREHKKLENLSWSLAASATDAYVAMGSSEAPVADLVQACAEAMDIAESLGTPFVQFVALIGMAQAQFLAGNFEECERFSARYLAESSEAGTACETQGYMLAVSSSSCLARGDFSAAIAHARDGIACADRGGAWQQSAFARTALIDALVATGAPEQEITPVIAETHELVRKSHGNSLLPRLREAEARLAGRTDRAAMIEGLREAQAMWRSMGAPDPVARLERELAP